MMKTIKTIMTQDKERYKVPRRVQDVIPISSIWNDGIFRVGKVFQMEIILRLFNSACCKGNGLCLFVDDIVCIN